MKNLGGIFDLDHAREEVERIDAESHDPNFWDNPEKATAIMQEKGRYQTTLETMAREKGHIDDAEVLLSLSKDENDPSLIEEAIAELDTAEKGIRRLEMMRMLSGPNDRNNAIISINPGAGGTEAHDWANMLLRMVMRYCERKKFTVDLVDFQPGDEAGLASATLEVSGEYAFGLLKAISGVHRLVRISPFDANARRHTSFASIFVYPEIDDSIHITIEEKDIRVDTYRASGAGGQHINKTSSAIRITHFPTGIVVTCQNERSQHSNRETAMKILRARLYDKQLREQEAKLDAINANKSAINFGSQIASYVLHPYQMVKDHRTVYETSRTGDILDGDLDDLITTYLLASNGAGDPTLLNSHSNDA
ncbi:MAG: peptide chain release factor 2 [Proteobacteria bacterium]|jgi:peptide chain release factor 2|nr:peptide chain release factor 2 [Pseudomonadota bacterium]